MDYRELAAAVVAVVGVALLLYGLSMPSFTGELVVEDPVDAAEVDEDAVVAYEDLSSENRAAFDRALEEGGETNYQHQRWDHEVVAYDGQYYPTSTWGGENGMRLWTIVGGLGLLLLGGIAFAGLRSFKWWNGRKQIQG